MGLKASNSKKQEKFKKALASVLSASPEQIRESRAQAKAEKPSPHKRYSYAPEEGQS
jgi:hypothetical protein